MAAKSKKKAAPNGGNDAGLMSQYDDIMSAVLSDIEAPKPLPVGRWTLKALSVKFKARPTKDERDMFLFGYTAIAAGDNVDADELADAEWKGTRLWFRIYIEGQGDAFNLAKHFTRHGVDIAGRRTPEVLEMFNKGKPMVTADVGVRQYTDNTGTVRIDNTLSNFIPVD